MFSCLCRTASKSEHIFEDVPLVGFMYLTRMPGKSYRRRFRFVLLCPMSVECNECPLFGDISGYIFQIRFFFKRFSLVHRTRTKYSYLLGFLFQQCIFFLIPQFLLFSLYVFEFTPCVRSSMPNVWLQRSITCFFFLLHFGLNLWKISVKEMLPCSLAKVLEKRDKKRNLKNIYISVT